MTFRATPPIPSCRHMNRSANALPTSPLSVNLFALTVPTKSADAKVEPVRAALTTFGWHLCSLDLRQNSAVNERVVDELLRTSGICNDYLDRNEADRVELLLSAIESRRHCTTDSMITQTKPLESSRCISRQLTQFAVSGKRHSAPHHLDGHVGV